MTSRCQFSDFLAGCGSDVRISKHGCSDTLMQGVGDRLANAFWCLLLASGLIFDHGNVVDNQEFPAAMVASESANVD